MTAVYKLQNRPHFHCQLMKACSMIKYQILIVAVFLSGLGRNIISLVFCDEDVNTNPMFYLAQEYITGQDEVLFWLKTHFTPYEQTSYVSSQKEDETLCKGCKVM